MSLPEKWFLVPASALQSVKNREEIYDSVVQDKFAQELERRIKDYEGLIERGKDGRTLNEYVAKREEAISIRCALKRNIEKHNTI